MRPFLLPVASSLVLLVSCGKKDAEQTPIPNNKAMIWIKNYGGANNDFAYSVVPTSGNTYIMAGATRSVDGDVTGSRSGYDAWIQKLDNTGAKLWSKTYGGANDDYVNSAIAATDGSIYLAGYTFLGGTNYAAWVMKTDANGNLLWQKDFAATTDVKANGIIASSDGGVIVVGSTRNTSTNYDGMVTKLNAGGNTVWTKTFGGSAEDYLQAVIQAPGGYLISGQSKSSDGDVLRGNGNLDGWVMMIDENGNKTWSKTFGGSGDDYFTSITKGPDNGFLVAGYTTSGNGDIARNSGVTDEWLLKVDASGNKEWSKTYGGSNDDYATGVVTTADGGYVIAGYTNSTNGDVTRNAGDFGGWLLKIDASGNKKAASTYGNTYDDFTRSVVRTDDGGYLLSGYTTINNTNHDAWIVKIGDLQ